MNSIIKNLVSNAIKYTEAKGSVKVSVSGTAHSWSVEVCDTGIGIPSNEQYKVFSYFFGRVTLLIPNLREAGWG